MYRYLTKLLLAGVVAVILTVGPAHAFHKGSVHGGTPPGEDPPVEIQTLDSLSPCALDEVPKTLADGSWACQADTDTNTQLDAAGVEALGFVTGAHTGATDLTAVNALITNLQAKADNLALLASRQASAFIFVSSITVLGALGGGGVEDANDFCTALANFAGLPGDYLAWLAGTNPASAPLTTFFPASGAYIRPDGVQVADNFADLISGSVDVPIQVDEDGNNLGNVRVWTNVLPSGAQIGATNDDSCANWTVGTGANDGNVGSSASSSGAWTDAGFSVGCNSTSEHLYCVGQGLVF